MTKKYLPVSPKLPKFFHGGDYNPDQWLHNPEVLKEDIRLMKLSRCNVMSIGIFSWTALEPEEGVFTFDWLDRVMDSLASAQVYAILATPSGAKPAWMAKKYPEILRVNAARVRETQGNRHNHCFSSPVYRERVLIINTKLAEQYKDHPALVLWHISNEYSGDCHCDFCQKAFCSWLRRKYNDDLDALNRAWWASFWNHTFTDWDQIESPSAIGEQFIHGMNLDWKRFTTDQTIDFMKNEIKPLKKIAPAIPVTTNLMGTFPGLNYRKFSGELDIISWDNYPRWYEGTSLYDTASYSAFVHDLNRSLKNGKPFLLMESTPSVTNWMSVPKLKRPGLHLISSLQAVAHGSDSVQYFQWRKGRGGCEKLHGAVVDHVGHEHTRVFKEVTEVGEVLEKISEVVGAIVPAETAIIFDWENRWAIEDYKGPGNDGRKKYEETCRSHYYPFWEKGIPVDIIGPESDFSQYKIIIAPMLYMVKPDDGPRLAAFTANGGIFVSTYLTGIADENDLCFTTGFPGPLRQLLGIWAEEIDCLCPGEKNYIIPSKTAAGLQGEYEAFDFCDLIHTESAETLAIYKNDFYSGSPALTVNNVGKGKAYYMASRNDNRFLDDFYSGLVSSCGLKKAVETRSSLPAGITTQIRVSEEKEYVFLFNFSDTARTIELVEPGYTDMISKQPAAGSLQIMPLGMRILERRKT